MSESEYSEKKKSKLKSSRRVKKAKDYSDDSLNASTSSLAIQQPLVHTPAPDYRDSRLKEHSIRHDLLEEHLQIEQSLDPSDDLATLAPFIPPSPEARDLSERPYSGPSAMGGFRGLEKWARDLNLPVSSCPEPEIVLIGPAGEGKTSVLSALLGVPMSMGNSTKRPFVYHVGGTNLLSSEKVDKDDAVVIRRDAFLTEFGGESILPNGSLDLPAEVEKRNRPTEEPVDIDIQIPGHIRMTLVDTPGFLLDPDAEGAALAEATLKAAIAPSNRLIVVVRRALDVSGSSSGDYLMDLVKQADPTLSRTVAVYTHLSTYLQSAAATQNPKAASRFLSASTLAGTGAAAGGGNNAGSAAGNVGSNGISDGRVFFATFPSWEKIGSLSAPSLEKCQANIENQNSMFACQVYRYAMRDLRSVESLQCDKQLIGAPNFARCIFSYVWRVHQASAPRILHALRARRTASSARLSALREQRERLSSPALFRVRAAAYTADFLRHLRALVAGSACGNPSLSGQTSAEERSACGGAWADSEGRPLSVRYGEWAVPNWQSKVYGGQQLERLLAEFSALCSHVTGDVITDDDVITAIGAPTLGGCGSSGYGSYRCRAEAACALACRRAEGALAPLIVQLRERASYVMKRLAPIAAKMIIEEEENKKSRVKETTEKVKNDSRFVHFVCERYAALVEAEAAKCAAMCAEEFHSVEAVSFAMVEEEMAAAEEDALLLSGGAEEEVRAVREMERRVFERIRERVVGNVVMRFYGMFVVPVMEGEIWGKLQRGVSELGDDMVESLFEAVKVKAELEKEEVAIQKEVDSLEESEKDILKLSAAFCHPKN